MEDTRFMTESVIPFVSTCTTPGTGILRFTGSKLDWVFRSP